MKLLRRIASRPYLFVLVHAGKGHPYAMRLHVPQLTTFAFALALALSGALAGTLLFFREVEINRGLETRVLELEIRDRLTHTFPLAPEAVTKPTKSDAKPQTPTREIVSTSPLPTNIPASLHPPTAGLGNIAVRRSDEDVIAEFTLIPLVEGTVEGHLLVILETEIPRIGTGSQSTNQRKRFFIYPGHQSLDQVEQETLEKLERKTFSFARALPSTVNFKVGRLLRPLALNIYLFDKENKLSHHERKLIEMEE